MKYLFFLSTITLIISSCRKGEFIRKDTLSYYLEQNSELPQANLIACAAGSPIGLNQNGDYGSFMFFYPVAGATDFKYYEAKNIADSLDFSKYIEKILPQQPVFNGYLRRFVLEPFAGERMGMVTYMANGNLHICDPVRIKTNLKPTEVNASLGTINETGINPEFSWTDGTIDENVIYFQVVSDTLGNLISGTYTYDKNFTFYDLSNVVLNIKDVTPAPSLLPNTKYNFTMMAVSEDNWVNLLIQKSFMTN